jgi:OmpA-OmpF porin, OOP family
MNSTATRALLIVSAALALLSATVVHAASSSSAVTAEFDLIVTHDRQQGLAAELSDLTSGEIRIGQPLELKLQSKAAGFLSVFFVDSHGVVEVIKPTLGTMGNFLEAGKAVYFAGSDEQPWIARPPLGPAAIYVVVTAKPLGSIEAMGADSVNSHLIAAADAPRVVRAVVDEVRSAKDAHITRLQMDVQLDRGAEYTANDIIRYFTETTRSIAKPKLDVYINFAFNSADLLPTSIKALDTWGRVLSDPLMSRQTFVIGGHTDDVGADEYNYELSVRRAEAVRDYLVSRYTIDSKRLQVRGYGDTTPLIERTDEESRARNRRVDFERATSMSQR